MTSEVIPEISICLCTYKRPDKLASCLDSLLKQTIIWPFEVIVTDNDCHHSGEEVVGQAKAAFQKKTIPISYFVEPVQNIALARNRCVQSARGKFIAFIDDDEHASSYWLSNMYKTLIETKADGVWGGVLPDIPESFPTWMRRSRLFDRPNMKDRSIMPPGALRTGNAVIKKDLLTLRVGPFDEELGRTGGSDFDFFVWLQRRGFRFVWAENAEVFETTEEQRRRIGWHVRRAYRGGWGYSRNIVKHYGVGVGLIICLSRIIPSSFKASIHMIINLMNPRYAGLLLLLNLSTNFGKLGYFVGVKIEEYKS